MALLKCNGIKDGKACGETELIESHIIPRAFARRVKGSQDLLAVTKKGTKKPSTQHGIYDKNILCMTCDQVLGDYDKYAIETCKKVNSQALINDVGWILPNVSGDKFVKFILAILWRASISKRAEFDQIKLGVYGNEARDVLYNLKPLALLPSFEVLISKYKSDRYRVERLYCHPCPVPFGQYNAFGLVLSGFKITAKVDPRPFPSEWRPFIVNGNDKLCGITIDWDTSNEFELLRQYSRK